MSSLIPSERKWDHAEALVWQWEQASRVGNDCEAFYAQVLNSLHEFYGATVSLWVYDRNEPTCLAGAGKTHPAAPESNVTKSYDFTPSTFWCPPGPMNVASVNTKLDAYQRLHPEVMLCLSLAWLAEDAVIIDASQQTTIEDLAKAAVEIVGSVYLRKRFAELRLVTLPNKDRELSIAALHRGVTLRESFHWIAKVWASHVAADRVSIVRMTSTRGVLIATSASEAVDRRSRLARLLESFADEAAMLDERVEFTVGQSPSKKFQSQALLDRYLIESGCRRIKTELVHQASDEGKPLAMIISEWFIVAEPQSDLSFQKHVESAIRVALDRDAATWMTALRRGSEGHFLSRFFLLCLVIFGSILALSLTPIRFTIPADGRVQPEVHRRLFAPTNAIVTRIAVRNGQSVKQGDELFTLRSSSIDLRDEQLRGELITAKTRLASLGASRSVNRSSATQASTDALSISADEESLKTEIAGLERQLALLAEQKSELTILSPIDGKVDRWNLEQSLTMRPVAQGQYLADIYSTSKTWVIELELPDKHAGYLHSQDKLAREVRFRLQSQPDQVFGATVTEIAESASINSQGQSIIRLKCEFNAEQSEQLAIGATVWADVDCGRRSLGFVWFRGLIEWLEHQSWY